jgi:hypothetical protein
MAEELQNQKQKTTGRQDDVEAHGNVPMIDDDPDELKTKLANDEDDDVEAHKIHSKQHHGQQA